MPSLEIADCPGEEGHRGIFHFNYMLLYWQGMFPDGPDMDTHRLDPRLANYLTSHRLLRRSLRFFRIVYPWTMMVFMCTSALVIHFGGILHRWDSKLDVVDNSYPMGLWALIINTTGSIMLKKTEFKQLMTRLEGLSRERNLDNEYQRKLVRKMNRWGYNAFKYVHLIVFTFVSPTIPMYSVFECLPERKLFFRSWYPYDETSSPAYELTLAISTVEVILGFFMANCAHCFILTCCINLGVLFKVLANKFLNIREIAIERLLERKRKALKRRMAAMPCPRRVPRAEYHVCVRHGASRDVTRSLRGGGEVTLESRLRPVARRGRSMPVPPAVELRYSQQELEREMESLLVEFVQFHKELMGIKNELDTYCQLYFIITSGINVVIYGTTVLIISTHEVISILEIIILLITVEAVLIFLILNYLCDVITDEAQLVGEAVYSSDWLSCSTNYKRSMLIVMSMINQPLDFKPMGIEPLSLKNFAKITNTAYKMTTTLSSMV